MADLWAMHVQGPDSVIAMASKEDAEREAAGLNAAYEEFKKRPDASENDGRWHAVVIPWDGSEEDHAQCLADADGDYF